MITILETQTINDPITGEPLHRAVKISITNNGQSCLWHVGGLPFGGDLQSILDARFEELWIAASEKAIPTPTAEVFHLPIIAPDFLVATPKINDDPEKALDEAIAEMEKGEGEKSIALIALSLAKYLKSKKNKLK